MATSVELVKQNPLSPAENYDALATIARQSWGSTLLGAYDAVVTGKHVKKPRR